MRKLLISSVVLIGCALSPVMASETHQAATHHPVAIKTATTPVDINKADEAQFTTLKGIGPKKAEAIIAYRTQHGAFKSVNDLTHVKGIGEKSLARLESKNPNRIIIAK